MARRTFLTSRIWTPPSIENTSSGATHRLRKALRGGAKHTLAFLARKALKIFLHNCLYTVYLRVLDRLDRAEPLMQATAWYVTYGGASESPSAADPTVAAGRSNCGAEAAGAVFVDRANDHLNY